MEKRRNMFHERQEEVAKQMKVLEKTMNTIKYKCWYYDIAISLGTDKEMKNLSLDEIPEELREYKI